MASIYTDENGKHHVSMSQKEWAERAAEKERSAKFWKWATAQIEAHGQDATKWEAYK